MHKKITTSLCAMWIIAAFYVIFFWNSDTLYWNTCQHRSAIDQCFQENKVWWDPRSLPFMCPASSDVEFQAYQVILDREFTPYDNEIIEYLNSLETQSNRYYSGWPTYLDWYDEITQLFGRNGEYWNKYRAFCDVDESQDSAIVKQVLACRGDQWSIAQASEYLEDSNCEFLVETKLNIYRDVANDIIKRNKSVVVNQRQSNYLKAQWDTYSWLIDIFWNNLTLLRRIAKKYPSKNSKNGVPK